MVVTTADESMAEVNCAFDTVLQGLSRVVVEECWGYEDYNDDFKAVLRDVFRVMLEQRARLKGEKG